MDAGLSAMKNHNGPGYGGSSKLQMRNQLLQSDIGNIDVSQEVPSRAQPGQQYPPQGSQPFVSQQQLPPQQFNQPYSQHQYPQHQYPQHQYPQHQYSQQQFPRQQFPQHQYPVNRDSHFNGVTPSTGQSMLQNQQSQRGPTKRDTHSSREQPERRAYSLNQKSLSSFFKNRGSRFSHNKDKLQDSQEEDEENTILADGEESMLTFNDLKRTLGSKGGGRYGHGGDTAPIIPTLVTKEHSNMNNMEYRKFLTAQRKMAMNTANKQNVGGPLPDGRAMSLQTYNTGSPLTQNRVSPYPYGHGGPPYNDSRANSLMRGPPHLQQQSQQKQPNGFPPHVMPGIDPMQGGGQRAMSLLMPQARPVPANMGSLVNAPSTNNGYEHPQLSGQPPSQIYMQNGASSSSENFSRSNLISKPPMPSSSASNSSNSSNPSVAGPAVDPSSSSTFENDNGAHMTSPLKHQMKAPSSPLEKGRLSVLKLSAPQQNELIEKEKLLAQREKELKEKELSIREHEAKIVNALAEKELKKLTLLRQEQQLKATGTQEQTDLTDQQSKNLGIEDDHLNLDPLPVLEAGLNSLSFAHKVDSSPKHAENRISSSTFISTFSESPQKVDKFKNPSGMYKLEKSANNSVFVTAPEFPNDMEIKSDSSRTSTGTELQRKNSSNTSTESVNDGNSTLKGSIIPENDLKDSLERMNSSNSEMRSKKRSSFGKAKNFLRKMSSSSITKEKEREKEKESRLSLRRSPSNVSIGSLPSSNNDTFHYRTQNRRSDNKLPVNSAPSSTGVNGSLNPSADLQVKSVAHNNTASSDPNEFVFDNTIGKPYQPSFASSDEVLKAEKNRTITISGEQLNILTENRQLMQEITLVSMELAESIKRETVLESQLRDLADGKDLSSENNLLSLAEFEIELRKKSSKIVELIQQLNDERLKRFIAEEQILLQEHGVKPSSIELVHTISRLTAQLEEKEVEISRLKEEEYNNYGKL